MAEHTVAQEKPPIAVGDSVIYTTVGGRRFKAKVLAIHTPQQPEDGPRFERSADIEYVGYGVTNHETVWLRQLRKVV